LVKKKFIFFLALHNTLRFHGLTHCDNEQEVWRTANEKYFFNYFKLSRGIGNRRHARIKQESPGEFRGFVFRDKCGSVAPTHYG